MRNSGRELHSAARIGLPSRSNLTNDGRESGRCGAKLENERRLQKGLDQVAQRGVRSWETASQKRTLAVAAIFVIRGPKPMDSGSWLMWSNGK